MTLNRCLSAYQRAGFCFHGYSGMIYVKYWMCVDVISVVTD